MLPRMLRRSCVAAMVRTWPAAAEVLAAAGRLIEGPAGGPLTEAARDCDRAAHEAGGRLPAPGRGGAVLRAAAFQLAQGGVGRDGPRPRRSRRWMPRSVGCRCRLANSARPKAARPRRQQRAGRHSRSATRAVTGVDRRGAGPTRRTGPRQSRNRTGGRTEVDSAAHAKSCTAGTWPMTMQPRSWPYDEAPYDGGPRAHLQLVRGVPRLPLSR